VKKNNVEEIAVIGLGFVGLPLAILLVSKGFKVIGLDVDEEKIRSLKNGKSYISDISDDILLSAIRSHQFTVTSNYDGLVNAQTIIICVPTPVNHDKSPNLNYVMTAAESIQKRLRNGQLVILESSTYPGTTRDIVKPILEKSGLQVGKDFYLAYSPERVDPGNKQFDIDNIPKVIGGITNNCKETACDLYAKVYCKVVPVSSTEVAETTKLLENTYRFINISFMNEMSMMCEVLGINLWEVIDAASTKPYGYHPFYPGPGISGHCIPVDPLYLQFVIEQNGLQSQFIRLSDEMNKAIVQFIVKRTFEICEKGDGKQNPTVLIYGLTYKKDVADIRDSRALDIFNQLQLEGANVIYHDPYIPEVKIADEMKQSVVLDSKILQSNDIVLILTDHSVIPIEQILQHANVIFDTRAVIKQNLKNSKVIQLGNGVK
jgi:UDP-N-acetyl-D-glucosamine dehydrogenase